MKKTGYEWSLEASVRIIELSDWVTGDDLISFEKSYYEEKIDLETFYLRLNNCRVKPNSQPRKTEMYLEYRMYGLVAYQLCGTIHAGIQFGHAVVEYGRSVNGITPSEHIYNKWADKDKTFIILNGGTTNNNPERLGSLNQHKDNLAEAGVLFETFSEPDLGDQLTAIVFLVDERVYNRTLYPDFISESIPWGKKKPSEKQISLLEEKNLNNYKHWEEKIGGPKNAFLRDYLRNLRLA
jgi:hypothetical protein